MSLVPNLVLVGGLGGTAWWQYRSWTKKKESKNESSANLKQLHPRNQQKGSDLNARKGQVSRNQNQPK
jgi:hypothetical protein